MHTMIVLRSSTTFTTRQRQLTKDRQHSIIISFLPFMKTAILILSLMSLSTFADVMYSYTYVTRTHKCAVDIFVPTS